MLRLSSYGDLVRAGVSFHPAHTGIALALGESEEELLKGARGVPQVGDKFP